MIEDLVNNEINSFKKMYIKDREIRSAILVGDYINYVVRRFRKKDNNEFVTKEELLENFDWLMKLYPRQMAKERGIPAENESLILPAIVIYRRLILDIQPELIWAPGLNLSDGLAYDYAEQHKIMKSSHNFENDILLAAKNIGKRYAVNRPHVQNLEMTALAMFDATKKMHGMKERERLLLRMAVMLHDVGKYISLNNVADSSYNIIMSNEIIGLSHIEREMVALIAKYNTAVLPSYDELVMESSLSAEQYLTVSELTAIVRLANALDRSHLQKIQSIRAVLKERELHLSLTVGRDFTLEQGLCQDKLDFFNEVFSIQPIIKMKRQM